MRIATILPFRRDPFAGVAVDAERRARLRRRPPASLDYVIHFTPRSGSSRLTEILAATKRLSAANEAFNPSFVPRMAQALNAADLDDYVAALRRRFNTGGIYGVEVTAHHVTALFGGFDAFHAHFPTARNFWLIREDIVAQAVSLAKMVATKVAHNTGGKGPEDDGFAYDAGQIRHWLGHIRKAETACEDWFARAGITPLRMSYEQTVALSPLQLANLVARHLGLPDIPPMPFETRHEKLGTGQNADFAARFRAEAADFLAGVEAARAPMLARLDRVAGMVADLAGERPENSL
ncbi:MAG: hypothetical protein JJT81_03240 [Rubellimicrobium sp.]|jgi:LPS sulfotransferase NodH|nr:hypothetical protein [Rubellimicrobium sp.]